MQRLKIAVLNQYKYGVASARNGILLICDYYEIREIYINPGYRDFCLRLYRPSAMGR